MYSFIEKPKHIFLIHGEKEAREVLKEKIKETANIPVSLPTYGEMYELNGEIDNAKQVATIDQERYIRLETLDRLATLQEELEEMISIIKNDVKSKEKTDKDIEAINKKIRDLEQYIVKVIE